MFRKFTRLTGVSGYLRALTLAASQTQGNNANQVAPVSLEIQPKEAKGKTRDRTAMDSLTGVRVLILSEISDDPASKIEAYQPRADYVANQDVD